MQPGTQTGRQTDRDTHTHTHSHTHIHTHAHTHAHTHTFTFTHTHTRTHTFTHTHTHTHTHDAGLQILPREPVVADAATATTAPGAVLSQVPLRPSHVSDPMATANTFVVTATEAEAKRKQGRHNPHHVRCVSRQWILDSISHFKLL